MRKRKGRTALSVSRDREGTAANLSHSSRQVPALSRLNDLISPSIGPTRKKGGGRVKKAFLFLLLFALLLTGCAARGGEDEKPD